MINLAFSVGIITNIVILLSISNGVVSEFRTCCGTGTLFTDNMTCSEGNMFISCDGELTLYENEEFFKQFQLTKENETVFLHENVTGLNLSLDKVCMQYVPETLPNKESVVVPGFILCKPNCDVGEPTEIAIVSVISVISSLLLAITAFIYFTIPQTQDVEGKCIFHLALTLGFCHFWVPYRYWFTHVEIFSHFCITEFYVSMYAVLSSFSWTAVLSCHTWSQFRNIIRLGQSKLMLRYLLFGYGFPGLLILLANIHTHAGNLYHNSSWQWSCEEHQYMMVFLYAFTPWFILELANVIFFVDLQRLLWIVHLSNSQERTGSFVKKLQFKLMINLRLFIIMGLPWCIIAFCLILGTWGNVPYAFEIAILIFLLVSTEGIFIFCIMVPGRKRVRQGIADKFGIMKCKPGSDMETSLESGTEDEVDDGQELQIRNVENGK